MTSEYVQPLDAESLNLFAAKGTQGGPGIKQVGNANGVKVRRVIQTTQDLANVPFNELRILDLACGEGVYSIEAALRGAEVVAIDARNDRMNDGVQIVERLGIKRIKFEQNDIRKVNRESHGEFDVIFFLGILYHLDESDIFPILHNIFTMCKKFVVIDTHIAMNCLYRVKHNGHLYEGLQGREHADSDSDSVRKGRLLASLDNALCFQFTKESLFRMLNNIGFTSVYECNVPQEPFKPKNRTTVIAVKGTPVKISCYPWVNDKTENEIKVFLEDIEQSTQKHAGRSRLSLKQFLKSIINRILRPLNVEIRHIENSSKVSS